ncbi:hypothetical protein EUGRSUZ_I01851 [Eucalyptus grandis]|uniref:Uncharacterized protein n=2 Tax=Eucalyptus grandis TaxID=71139 RepID=A0ACC3JGR5_EUCGR|nr:hypothetical protein EUGRSUZ_I01851 [Eucalyptus grandis]
MVSLSFSIWTCRGHIEMWVEEASKSEGRAVGHVTCTELVADWAFSLIKADQLAFFLSKSQSNRAAPCPLFQLFRSGIRPRTTSLVVVRKARTPRTSRAPLRKESLNQNHIPFACGCS